MLIGILVVVATPTAYSQMNRPNSETPSTQQQPASEQHGTEHAPSSFQIQQSSQARKKLDTNTDEGSKKEDEGWLSGWSLSDRIAGIASAAALLQFVALLATLWIMVRNGRRQLRAYVFADNGGLLDGTMLNPPNPAKANEPGVVLIFKNSGQTPAYKVVSWAQIAVLPPNNETALTVPVLGEHFINNIGPGGMMPKALWYGRQLNATEIEKIFSVAKIIYVYGRVEYRDAFNRKHWTNFRFAYAGAFPPAPGAIFNVTEQGNDAN